MAPTDDSDDERRRLAGDAAVGHAWDWFALHAKQRMQCVNFFLLAMAFLVAAFVTAVKDQHEGVASAAGHQVPSWKPQAAHVSPRRGASHLGHSLARRLPARALGQVVEVGGVGPHGSIVGPQRKGRCERR